MKFSGYGLANISWDPWHHMPSLGYSGFDMWGKHLQCPHIKCTLIICFRPVNMAFEYGNTGTTCYSSCAVSGKMWPQGALYLPISLGITGSVLGRSYMCLTSLDLGHICTFGKQAIIGLHNGLALKRWQAIIWTSDDVIHVFNSLLDLTLTQWGWVMHICINELGHHWFR